MAFEPGAGLGRYNGCIPTLPNARESEPYTLYCHQYYTVHTIKYHTVNIHLRHSAGSNLHINPTWKWIHEIWPLKGESLTFFKKIAQKWPKIMAYFQILYRKLGPHLFLSHHIVWSNVFLKKKQGSPLAASNSAWNTPYPSCHTNFELSNNLLFGPFWWLKDVIFKVDIALCLMYTTTQYIHQMCTVQIM